MPKKILSSIVCFIVCLILMSTVVHAANSSILVDGGNDWNVQITDKGILKWNDKGDTREFKIKIDKGQLGGPLLYLISDVKTNSYDLKKLLESEKVETGRYGLNIQTSKDGGVIESGEIKLTYISQQIKLWEPRNLKWNGNVATWDAMPGAGGYLVSLYDKKCNCLYSDKYIRENEYNFGNNVKDGCWFEVKTTADGKRNSNAAESPKYGSQGEESSYLSDRGLANWNVQLLDGNVLKWDDLGDTGEYRLKIGKYKEGIAGGLLFLQTLQNHSFELQKEFEERKVENGVYYITIQTSKNGSVVDSGNIKIAYVSKQPKLEAPSNVYWDGTVARWDAVSNASGYLVTLYKDNFTCLYSEKYVSATEYNFGNNAKDGCWFEVKAIADGYRNSNSRESMKYGVSRFIHGTFDNGVKWELNQETGVLTFEGNGEIPTKTTNSEYPWYPYCALITSVEVKDGVMNVPNYAFGNYQMYPNLTKVVLADTVVSIGKDAFFTAPIIDLKLSASLSSIGESAFVGAKFEEIVIPNHVEVIPTSAFMWCKQLKTISLPWRIREISDTAFYECVNLEKVFYSGTEKEWAQIKVGEGNEPLTSATIIYHDHKFDTKWKSDNKNHWKECVECGKKKEEASHTLKTTVKTKATLTENGKKETKCSICDKVTKTSTIYAAKTVKLSKSTYTYDGKEKKPSVTVKDSKDKTIDTKNYEVSYASGRKNVGKYTVKVTFKGEYKGSKSLSFKINPKKTAIKTLTPKSKSFEVTWEKQTAQVDGYEIQYSTSSTFASDNKTVKITKNTTTSKTVKDLKAKKKYYVRVRTYKTVKDTKYYSDWSEQKTVTTK